MQDGGADDALDIEEIVSAYRSRKAAQNARQDVGTPPAPPSPPPSDPPSPAAPATSPPAPEPFPVAGTPEPAAQSSRAAHAPPASESGVATRPAQRLQPATSAGRPLTALSPMLGLDHAILADRYLTVRGLPVGRRIGYGLVLLGALVLVAERRAAQDGAATAYAGVSLLAAAAALLTIGGLLAAVFTFLPPRRRLSVPLADSQESEWRRVRAEAARLRQLMVMGASLLGAAFALAVLGYSIAPLSGALRFLPAGLAATLGLAGAGTLLVAWARRGALHRLYVQTLVLARLERTGLGHPGADPRLAPVLKALDDLLGALPESAVRRFLASPEAEQYLELMDEVASDGGRDGA